MSNEKISIKEAGKKVRNLCLSDVRSVGVGDGEPCINLEWGEISLSELKELVSILERVEA